MLAAAVTPEACPPEVHAALKLSRATFEAGTLGLPHRGGARVVVGNLTYACCARCSSCVIWDDSAPETIAGAVAEYMDAVQTRPWVAK